MMKTDIYTLFNCDLIGVYIMQKGITILLINLDNSTTIQAKVGFSGSWSWRHQHRAHKRGGYKHRPWGYPHKHRPRKIRRVLRKFGSAREEYHLTAKDGNLHSQTVLLNGNILTVNSSGGIPPLKPLYAKPLRPIKIAPHSIVFAHIPNLVLPACM
jgi:heparanase 1